MTTPSEGRSRVLIVDDEPGICRALARYLSARGFEPVIASNGADAIDRARSLAPRIALVDFRLPGMDGREVIRRLRDVDEGITSILMTAYGGFDTAVEATLDGAYAYLPKPLDLDEIGRLVEDISGRPELAVIPGGDSTLPGEPWVLAGRSEQATRLRTALRSARSSGGAVLLVGEVGSGRARLARWLSEADPTGQPHTVVILDIDELDWQALESMLNAADTGRGDPRPGLVATARPAPPDRDARAPDHVIDLARRRGWVEIPVPSLRERLDDLRELVAAALVDINAELELGVVGVDRGALLALQDHGWPGNLRELDNVLRFAAMAGRGGVIRGSSLPRPLRRDRDGADRAESSSTGRSRG